MTNRIWFSDFHWHKGGLTVKKTGAYIPINLALLNDVATWLTFYIFAQSWRIWRRITGHKRPTIAFAPEKPRPWYFIWPVMHAAGAKLISDTSRADIVFQFEDATTTDNSVPWTKSGAILVNFDCNDISKSLVERVFKEAAGYDLAVNPKTHQGPMVEKSDINGAHDGRIVEGPLAEPKADRTYQRLIDNEIPGGLVEDLRTCIVGGEPAIVMRKRRALARRFMNENTEVILDTPERVFTSEELDIIRKFAAGMHLDWGGIDVLRDRDTGKIHIVDANKTDMGPPLALPLKYKLRATRLMARAFSTAFEKKRTDKKTSPMIRSQKVAQKVAEAKARPPFAGIPYVREIDFEYGRVDQVSPLIRRVIANNPNPFTYIGTGVYIIGKGNVAVIDPGPMDEAHFEALKQALEGETVTHVLVTHGHSDHSPLAAPLAEWAGCKVYAAAGAIPTAKGELGSEDDLTFKPDEIIKDGDVISGPGWTLDIIETPGHTAHHLCFGLREENACLSGDHIMGWSTTVVSPPDGDMGDYMRSLKKIQDMNFDILWPTHGAPVKDDVNSFIEAYAEHRRSREASILIQLDDGQTNIPDMVKVMYADIDKRLHPAACHSVLGHMVELVKEGIVRCSDDKPTVSSEYQLNVLADA